MNYIYSVTTNSFYPLEMKEDYTQADSCAYYREGDR